MKAIEGHTVILAKMLINSVRQNLRFTAQSGIWASLIKERSSRIVSCFSEASLNIFGERRSKLEAFTLVLPSFLD